MQIIPGLFMDHRNRTGQVRKLTCFAKRTLNIWRYSISTQCQLVKKETNSFQGSRWRHPVLQRHRLASWSQHQRTASHQHQDVVRKKVPGWHLSILYKDKLEEISARRFSAIFLGPPRKFNSAKSWPSLAKFVGLPSNLLWLDFVDL